MEELFLEKKAVLTEWDAFCQKIMKDVGRYDAGKEPPEDDADCSKELDQFLRLFFFPPADGIPHDIFAETPPVLEKALGLRIDYATILLNQILENQGGLRLSSSSDPGQGLYMFFRDLLLPSPPEPGDYH